WAGADVLDLGATTAPCLAHAIARTRAAGGMYLGNAGGDVHQASMRFWGTGGHPLSQAAGLEAVQAALAAHHDRPGRAAARAASSPAVETYQARLRPLYHALRPLRIVLDTTCQPLLYTVRQLISAVGCRVSPGREA